MTIAHGSSGDAGFGLPSSFMFNPAAPPKGAVVIIVQQGSSSDLVTGVSYGGVAMTRKATAADTAGEAGRVYAYFLGRYIPPGLQSIAVAGSATTVHAFVSTVTSSLGMDTEVVDTSTVAEDGADPQLTLSTGSRKALRYIGVFSGHDAVGSLTLLGLCTAIASSDFGTQVALVSRQTDPSGYAFTLGYTATTEDRAAAGVAIAEVVGVLNVNTRLFCRKPPSITAQGNVKFGSGAFAYAELQHPTEARVYQVISSGLTVLNIATRTAPTVVGTVTAAAGLMGNNALDGLVFDSTGRYLYATSGDTSLYTFDLGAGLVNKDNPTLASTVTISAGQGWHVLKRWLTDLYSLADTATNNSFQVISISTPSTPSVSSTTAITGQDLEASVANLWINQAATNALISYPAGETSGKILSVPVLSPSSFQILQLPTLGGQQIRCFGGVTGNVFHAPDDKHLAVYSHVLIGGIQHEFWMIYDVSSGAVFGDGHSTANAICTTEDIVGGAIASRRAPLVCSSPKSGSHWGHAWNDGNDVFHLAIAVQDFSASLPAEVRFYAWGVGAEFSRVPRLSGAVAVPGAYAIRVRNDGATKTDWLSVGISADTTNAILCLLTSDLLQSAPDFVNDWFEFQDDLFEKTIEYGMSGNGPRDRVAHTGTLEGEIDNSDVNLVANLGGYSPDSAAPVSALFQDGSPVILTMNTGAGDKKEFYGTVSRINPSPGRWDGPKVRLTCTDGIEALVIAKVDTLPLRAGITTEEALRTLWDRVPYVPGTESLSFDGSEGSFVHDYVFDRAYDEKTKVIGEINKLVAVSRGLFFYRHHDGGGMTFSSLDAYKKAGAIFNGVATILSDTKFRALEVGRDVENIYNSVTVSYYPRRVDSAATTVLFTTQQRVFIKPGITITIEAQYRDPGGLASRVGGTEMVYPVAVTDYTFRPKKNGGGTNLNAQLSVSADFGATAARIIASNAGPLGGYFFTQLRGKGVYTQEPIEVTEQDADSVTKYGLREYSYDAQYIGNEQDARALAKAILAATKDPRTFASSIGFDLDSDSVTEAVALMGPSRKLGVQETVTGLVAPDYWTLGIGALDDTSGSNNSNLYGLDVYSVQRVKMEIKSQGRVNATLDLVPEDMTFRRSAWIDPKEDWTDGETIFAGLHDLHLYDDILALWHEKKSQASDVSKTDTTFSKLTGQTFSIKAGETFQFFAILFIDSNSTANAKVTITAEDQNGNDNSASVFGRFGFWGAGTVITAGNSEVFGTALNYNIIGTDEEMAILSGRVTSPIDAEIFVKGAQNTASGTTVFRTLSPIIAFRVEGP